jgi:hypothetical protein
VFKLLQLYANDTLYIRNVTDSGVDFTEVNMSDFLGEYTPMVTLDIMKKLEDAEKREAYLQAYQMLISDPTNNLPKIKEYILPKALPDLDKEELKQIISTPAQEQEQPEVVEEKIDETMPAPTVEQLAQETEQPSLEEAYGE